MTRIGYLVSVYPAPSHTFVRREIDALRKAGLDIRPFSIRTSARPQGLAGAAWDETTTVLGRSPMAYLGACIAAFLRAPLRSLQTVRLALRHRVPGLRAWAWSLLHLVEAMMLARLLRKNGVGHLHVHFANSGATVGMLSAHFLGIPWSLTLHGISETDYPAGELLNAKISASRFAACASLFMRAQAMRRIDPEQWRKLHIVRCCVDPDALPRIVMDGGGEVTFVCVGRLSPEKGHHGLLAAFARVRRSGTPIRLRLIGEGPMMEELVVLSRDLGIAEDVSFLGPLDEVATLTEIARADALILASFMEGLPVVLIEAAALGKPVIASAVAGIPELIRDDVNGLLFVPSDWDALADSIERLAGDEALRARLGRAGGEAVAQVYWSQAAVRPLRALFLNEDAAE